MTLSKVNGRRNLERDVNPFILIATMKESTGKELRSMNQNLTRKLDIETFTSSKFQKKFFLGDLRPGISAKTMNTETEHKHE